MMDAFAALALESSLRVAMIIACAGIATWCLRRRAAETRHLVWLAALLATLVMPALVALGPRLSLPVLPARASVRSGVAPSWVASGSVAAAGAPHGGRPGRPGALPIVWLAGCVVLLGREIGSRRRLERRLAGSQFSLALHGAMRRAANELGLEQDVHCRATSHVTVPLVLGELRSTLLLPRSAEAWDRACLRRILLHELAHVRRRDPLWITIAHAVRMLFWFHPLVWVAVARLRDESEHACDDAVVRGGVRASDYAETLLFVAEEAGLLEDSMATPFVTRGGLESRISRLLSPCRDVRALGVLRRSLIAATASAVAIALAVTQPVAARASGDHSAPEAATPRAPGSGSDAWLTRAGKSLRVQAPFRDDAGAPVRIVEATVRVVPHAEGDETGITDVVLTLENGDRSRRVAGVRLALDLPGTNDRTECAVGIAAGGRGRLTLETHQWSAVVPATDVPHLLVHITAVRFDRGESWELAEPELRAPVAVPGSGDIVQSAPPAPVATTGPHASQLAPTPRPTPAGTPRSFPSGPTTPARFRNPSDAPVEILEARTPELDREAGAGETLLPEVRLANRSGHRLVAVKLRYKAEPEHHAVSVFSTSLEPGATAALWKDFVMQGRAADMTVEGLRDAGARRRHDCAGGRRPIRERRRLGIHGLADRLARRVGAATHKRRAIRLNPAHRSFRAFARY
jgi:beta-lactamase regulating signal transducer with metallopeptidase domain